MCLCTAAGHDQQNVPGGRRGSVSLGCALGTLLVELHYLLRQPTVVSAISLWPQPGGSYGGRLLDALSSLWRISSGADVDLWRRLFHLLHGLSRRTLPPETRAGTLDRFLPDALSRRRFGRSFCGYRVAGALQRLPRTAMGLRALRSSVSAAAWSRLAFGPSEELALETRLAAKLGCVGMQWAGCGLGWDAHRFLGAGPPTALNYRIQNAQLLRCAHRSGTNGH